MNTALISLVCVLLGFIVWMYMNRQKLVEEVRSAIARKNAAESRITSQESIIYSKDKMITEKATTLDNAIRDLRQARADIKAIQGCLDAVFTSTYLGPKKREEIKQSLIDTVNITFANQRQDPPVWSPVPKKPTKTSTTNEPTV